MPVLATGVCGSDRDRYAQGQPARTLGHEVVVETRHGPAVVRPLSGCRTCGDCRRGRIWACPRRQALGKSPTSAGGFNSTLTLADHRLVPIPHRHHDPSPFVWTDSVACVLRGLARLPFVPSRVAVIGRGAVAHAAALTLQHLHDASTSLLPSSACTEPREYDLVIEAAGGPSTAPLATAIQTCASGGHVVSLGVFPADSPARICPRSWLEREVAVIGVNSFRHGGGVDDFRAALDVVGDNVEAFRQRSTSVGLLDSDEALHAALTRVGKAKHAVKSVMVRGDR